MKLIGKHSCKPYRCIVCGNEEEHGTNHWGKIYPHCRVCRCTTVWECLEPVPEGYGIPKDWKVVKLGDLVEVKKV